MGRTSAAKVGPAARCAAGAGLVGALLAVVATTGGAVPGPSVSAGPDAALSSAAQLPGPGAPGPIIHGPSTPADLPSTAPAVGGTWSFLGPEPIANEVNFAGVGDGPLQKGAVPASQPLALKTQHWGDNSGRITSLVVSPTSPTTVYAGAAGGGVWRSVDGGQSWHPQTDGEATLSIGALAIDSTGRFLVAGTGEDNNNDDAIPGQGILESSDSGGTWTLVGRSTFAGHFVSSVAIDRTTSGTSRHILVTSDLGLFESTNNGKSWARNTQFQSQLPAGASGAAVQVVQDPSVPADFWATTGDLCKTEPAEVLLSTDGGATWTTKLNVTGDRIGLAVGTSGVAYAAVSSCRGLLGGIKKTTNYGTRWAYTAASPSDYFNGGSGGSGQGWYDNVAAVDPTNNDVAVFGGVDIVSTSDGGASWADPGKIYKGGVIHPDFHAIAFSAANSFYVGNDGGVWSTSNLGTGWTNLNKGLAVTEFYRGTALDLQHVLGGAQDNAVSGFLGSATKKWTMYGSGGDGVDAAIDPTAGTPTNVYAESQNGDIFKASSATPTPGTPSAPCAGCTSEGFVDPFVMDPSNPKRLLTGNAFILQSWNGTSYDGGIPAGQNGWATISPPLLTTPDYFTDLEVGPVGEGNVVYAASAGGKIFRSTDTTEAPLLSQGQADWSNITGDLVPAGTPTGNWPFVSSIAFNPWNIDEAWITTSSTGAGVGHVWHTVNANAGAGTTWTDISGDLGDVPALGLAVDPRNPNDVYIGTPTGVELCSTCAGTGAAGAWTPFGTGMPHAWVNDLGFTRDHSSLVAWTYGRGAWSIPTPDVKKPTVITEYPEASGGSPQGMVAGPDGPWFADPSSGSVGHVNADGSVTMYPVGTAADGIENVTVGSDGNIWYTALNGNYLGVVSPDGTGVQHFPIPDASAQPKGITAGPDGNIWLVETASDIIDQFNIVTHVFGVRTGTVTHNSHPEYITAGSDGNLWFTEFTGLKIAKITTAGVVTEYSAPKNAGDFYGPFGTGLGPDGNVWFGNFADDTVTSITPSDVTSTVGLGAGHTQGPVGITSGPDGNLWVADGGAQNLIARVTPVTHAVKTYDIPTTGAESWGIAQGPDGNIWFTESQQGKIGMLQLSQS